MTAVGAVEGRTRVPSANPAWVVLAGRELRDLWLSGRGPTLMLAHTVLLSVSTYLVASNQELNFLEQREAVNLTLRVAVVVGGLLVVLAAADAISGERERGSLESLLLTPIPRTALVLGKGLAALSLWGAAFLLSVPYLWWIGRDVGLLREAVVGGALVGTLLTLFLVGLGLLVSILVRANVVSLALSFFVLLALVAPSQLPAEASRGWFGEMLLRADPFAAGLLYLDRITVNAHALSQDLGLLVSPAVAAVVLPVLALLAGHRLSLLGGRS